MERVPKVTTNLQGAINILNSSTDNFSTRKIGFIPAAHTEYYIGHYLGKCCDLLGLISPASAFINSATPPAKCWLAVSHKKKKSLQLCRWAATYMLLNPVRHRAHNIARKQEIGSIVTYSMDCVIPKSCERQAATVRR